MCIGDIPFRETFAPQLQTLDVGEVSNDITEDLLHLVAPNLKRLNYLQSEEEFEKPGVAARLETFLLQSKCSLSSLSIMHEDQAFWRDEIHYLLASDTICAIPHFTIRAPGSYLHPSDVSWIVSAMSFQPHGAQRAYFEPSNYCWHFGWGTYDFLRKYESFPFVIKSATERPKWRTCLDELDMDSACLIACITRVSEHILCEVRVLDVYAIMGVHEDRIFPPISLYHRLLMRIISEVQKPDVQVSWAEHRKAFEEELGCLFVNFKIIIALSKYIRTELDMAGLTGRARDIIPPCAAPPLQVAQDPQARRDPPTKLLLTRCHIDVHNQYLTPQPEGGTPLSALPDPPPASVALFSTHHPSLSSHLSPSLSFSLINTLTSSLYHPHS
ncbi:hypothetical protein CVT24_001921 [Panaeolus cyanescens]|uniref:Uncharacterized protein n=1 Tax=Panaeolus cyanescens TaxID=181874 RepID=A0A409WSI3_9AGAR|nr:hypothetical protein CVT24_001921 [Panaeolus cyanescens]